MITLSVIAIFCRCQKRNCKHRPGVFNLINVLTTHSVPIFFKEEYSLFTVSGFTCRVMVVSYDVTDLGELLSVNWSSGIYTITGCYRQIVGVTSLMAILSVLCVSYQLVMAYTHLRTHIARTLVNSLRPSGAYICVVELGHHWFR